MNDDAKGKPIEMWRRKAMGLQEVDVNKQMSEYTNRVQLLGTSTLIQTSDGRQAAVLDV